MTARQDRIAALKQIAKERILILDGSWGVMIQKRGLAEADRSDRAAAAAEHERIHRRIDGKSKRR